MEKGKKFDERPFIRIYGLTMIGSLVAGVKSGALAVMVVVPAPIPVTTAVPDIDSATARVTEGVTVAVSGVELVRVTRISLAAS